MVIRPDIRRRPAGRLVVEPELGGVRGIGMSSHAAVGPPVVAAPMKSSLPVQAIAYLVAVLAAAVALGGHFVLDVAHRRSRHGAVGDVRAAGDGVGARPALRGDHAPQPVVPHDNRLPRPGGAHPAAGAAPADRRRPARPRVAQAALPLVHPELQHRELHARPVRRVGHRARPPRRELADRRRVGAHRRGLGGRRRRLRGGESRRARGDAAPRTRAFLAHERPLQLREPLDRPRARDHGRPGHVDVADEPVAGRAGARSAGPHLPVARDPGARGGGARRPEDGPVQHAPLHHGARATSWIGRHGPSGRSRCS